MRNQKAPENARGIAAESAFWEMSEADQDRYRQGWWDFYEERKYHVHMRSSSAYLLGRAEAEATYAPKSKSSGGRRREGTR